MAQMRVAIGAAHLDPGHAVAGIAMLVDGAAGAVKAGPAAMAVEFRIPVEQFRTAAGAGEFARTSGKAGMGKRAFGPFFPQDRILGPGQPTAPLGFRQIDTKVLRLCPITPCSDQGQGHACA